MPLIRTNGRPWREVSGIVIHASGGGYWAWNSFKSCAYVSDLAHSEVFESRESAERWMERHNVKGKLSYGR
jgi:hypothetical protein